MADAETRLTALADAIEEANSVRYRPTSAVTGPIALATAGDPVVGVMADMALESDGRRYFGRLLILTPSLAISVELGKVSTAPMHASDEGSVSLQVVRRSAVAGVQLAVPARLVGNVATPVETTMLPREAKVVIRHEGLPVFVMEVRDRGPELRGPLEAVLRDLKQT